ncbi:hypothetical protein [Streptomyces longispororuber]|nr:hypothetical protein [Streptomyces longispororuber]
MRTARTAAAVTAVVAPAGGGGGPVPAGPAVVTGPDGPKPEKFAARGTR